MQCPECDSDGFLNTTSLGGIIVCHECGLVRDTEFRAYSSRYKRTVAKGHAFWSCVILIPAVATKWVLKLGHLTFTSR